MYFQEVLILLTKQTKSTIHFYDTNARDPIVELKNKSSMCALRTIQHVRS